MTDTTQIDPNCRTGVRIIRHAEVSGKLKVSSAKLFDMIAKGQFPKSFVIVPGGRAVGWLESDVDAWIIDRRANSQESLA
jgi:prophage regulatory protein